MERSPANQISSGSLSLPHFDDEVTLQRARPVVPLHETVAVSRRRLRLALALVAALLVGALGATLLYNFRDQPADPRESTLTKLAPNVEVSSSSEDGGDSIDSGEVPANDSIKEGRYMRQNSSVADSATVKRQGESASRSPAMKARATGDEDEIDLHEYHERMVRRAERREARRLQRAAERDANGKDRSARDLLRIREIFEGSPRP